MNKNNINKLVTKYVLTKNALKQRLSHDKNTWNKTINKMQLWIINDKQNEHVSKINIYINIYIHKHLHASLTRY